MINGLVAIAAFHAGGWRPNEAAADATARGLGFTNPELNAALIATGHKFSDALMAALDDLVIARNRETDFQGELAQLYGGVPFELKERMSLPATFEELLP